MSDEIKKDGALKLSLKVKNGLSVSGSARISVEQWEAITSIIETGQTKTERDLLKFKNYVHRRLDRIGIEKNPNGKHSKKGCRIGDRLDIVEQTIKLDSLKKSRKDKRVVEAIKLLKDLPGCPKGRFFYPDMNGDYYHFRTDQECIDPKRKLLHYHFDKDFVAKNPSWFSEPTHYR